MRIIMLCLVAAAVLGASLLWMNRTPAIAEQPSADPNRSDPMPTSKATFAAGCFWGVETTFRKMTGVISTRVGYLGGHLENPTYKQVCTDRTGHAEAVEITFDPAKISFAELLDAFWSLHDPTTLNRQGPDVGSQYRSAIFVHDEEQERQAKASMKEVEESGVFKRKIVTEIVPAVTFYAAEEYHQQYFAKAGREDSCHIGVANVRTKLAAEAAAHRKAAPAAQPAAGG